MEPFHTRRALSYLWSQGRTSSPRNEERILSSADASRAGPDPFSNRAVVGGPIHALDGVDAMSRAYASVGRKKCVTTYRAIFRPIHAPSIVELRK